ncbi:DUF6048 family protein [Flavobacterium sp. J372]|uniref:DUF6048 family protein n=1 Tax=Flavobacterium sp. J372 TaxID=2898436 RepID=UPI002151A843|nr:DUF6048 family protein [Flavobacterium sp. J372]MCR5863581.1 DUF6048 family protein [Flavobacterium sp. J372]
MSKFIFSLSLLLVSITGFAQTANDTTTAPEPVYKDRYGPRVGADLYRLTRGLYNDNYRGFEIVADYRLTKKYYVAGEIGNEDFTVDDDQLNFTTQGQYIKIGFDYNAYENWLDMENMIYAGVRYGFSRYSQNLNSYRIYDASGYFDETIFYPDRKFDGLTAHWAEVVGGVKAEIFDNLFLGFSVRLNYLITDKKPENFDNLYIPGFNRTYEGSFGAGFNYSLSYFIPLYKKDKVPKEEKK